MYQPEGFPAPLPEGDIEAFTVPTAKETTDAPAKPGRACPETPDRECMLRYLYAQKHKQHILCATCGRVAGKVSSMRRTAKNQAKPKLPKVAKTQTPKPKKSKAKLTPEERRRIQLETLAKANAARRAKALGEGWEELSPSQQAEYYREYRRRKTAEKKAALTPEQVAAQKERLAEIGRRNILKAQEAHRARVAATAAERAEKRRQTRAAANERRNEVRRLKRAMTAEARREDAHAAARASMELARLGSKPPTRREAVVMAMEWMLESGIKEVAMMDLLPAVNKFLVKKVANAGALGGSVRDYGLTVKAEYRPGLGHRAMLQLDDAARAFVAGGYVNHTVGHSRRFHDGN